jgi:hypothetical protein
MELDRQHIRHDHQPSRVAAGSSATSIVNSNPAPSPPQRLRDVGLPGGMNGRPFADAARELRADLKILFITGYSEGVVNRTGRLETGMQVLIEPFPLNALATRVNSMINS